LVIDIISYDQEDDVVGLNVFRPVNVLKIGLFDFVQLLAEAYLQQTAEDQHEVEQNTVEELYLRGLVDLLFDVLICEVVAVHVVRKEEWRGLCGLYDQPLFLASVHFIL